MLRNALKKSYEPNKFDEFEKKITFTSVHQISLSNNFLVHFLKSFSMDLKSV
jgi:hypothetical protein